MAPPNFGPLELIQGIFSTIFVVITIYIGSLFILKYFEHKNRNLYLFGIFWIGAATFFIAIPLQLFLIPLNITTPDHTYFFTMFVPLPIITVLWVMATSDLLNLKSRLLFLRITGIVAIIYEILFFSLYFIQASLIGLRSGPFYMELTPFGIFFVLSLCGFILIPGVALGRSSMDSKDPEIKMKGLLIIISILVFGIGALLDLFIPPLELDLVLKAIVTIIARIFMSSSGIMFYIAFYFPNWARKILFRKK